MSKLLECNANMSKFDEKENQDVACSFYDRADETVEHILRDC